ncbi:hypothetical protein [Brevibacterium casei]|uniref:Uncharacterized protein n=1 Tax=Brevibacterium casei CIP 102111 TaxID=1255625 RepID=A0A2H1KM56_9MICO|nr:hypothetical protein [Brevibacterium casei]MBE4696315.1 hypothetical protein [Brevibacterium casei]MBY3579437.1 hypothetical protein [Brevibacterium casei]QPR40230.1 hypothetical protein I6G94_05035 [Brevibacterium casei]QPR44386.1 hypothetical protein I6G93_02680 [Brevibacterium casei]SMY00895.1 hypothetical protein BC102111_03459 [Brevibacterium casei CIP 102111]
MKKKLILAVGVGAGFVLGSRAGRKQYNALVAKVRELWNSPQARRVVDATTGAVKDHAPDFAGQAGAKVKQFGVKAANQARAQGRTGLAENLDKAGDFAQDAAEHGGQAAANAAAQGDRDSNGNAHDEVTPQPAPQAKDA